MLDDFDLDMPEEEEPSGTGSNRTFIMIAGGIGALLVLALACMAIYALVIQPRQQEGAEAQSATQTTEAQQTLVAQSLTETAIVMAQSPTATRTLLPSATMEASPTVEMATVEVDLSATSVAPAATIEGGPTTDPRTATVQALLTSAAAAQTQAAGSLNTVTPTSTLISALPNAGFFDDAGAPALIAVAALLILVILMARRLRQVNS